MQRLTASLCWRLVLLATGLLCFACALCDAAPRHTLHFLLVDPKNTSLDVGAHRLQASLDRIAQGQLHLDIMADGMWLGQPRSELAILRIVHDGDAEMALISTAPLANFDPDFQILDTPFLFASYAEVDKVVDGTAGRELLGTLPQHGFQGLAFWDSGFRVVASRHSWQGMQDIKGQRVRVMQSEMYQEFMRLIGANPLPVGSDKVYDMVRSGYLDAVDMAYPALLQHHICDYNRYILETRHIDESKVVLINQQVYMRLSPQEQAWLTQAAWDARLSERKLYREEDAAAQATCRKQGVAITPLTAVERGKMLDACRPLYQKLSHQWDEPWQQALLSGHR